MDNRSKPPGLRYAALGMMAASGFAGLGYQIVWTRQAAVWLGSDAAAVLAVVAAYFGGIAFGAFAFGPLVERTGRPARWYAGGEAIAGAWAIVLLAAMPTVGEWMFGALGERPSSQWQWAVAFGTTFLALLPATAAMGVTLPAIERAWSGHDGRSRSIAAFYASNTFGAVAGVLATTFWMIPTFGLQRTAVCCIALSLSCAAIAVACLPNGAASRDRPMRPPARDALLRLFGTGLLGIGYEVVVVRVLSEVAEDTVYTFATLLAVYLAGTAIGATLLRRHVAGGPDRAALGDRLIVAQVAACIVGSATLWAAPALKNALSATAGTGMAGALAAEAAIAVAAFALPTIVMGALFGHLCALANQEGASFGRALGFNTIGAAAAPVVFGVLLIPSGGPRLALLAIIAGYLTLLSRRAWRSRLAWWPAAGAVSFAIVATPIVFVDVPDGGRIVSYEDGATAAVSVVEDAAGVTSLRIDNRQQEGTSATAFVDGRQALLPLLLHPAPRRALFLGLGTGVTATTAAADPSLDVDAVELLPEVIRASRLFADASPARLRTIAADARRFVRATRTRYDVIVSDNFHPARSGSGALYTVEHFERVKHALAAEGLFCQWLPLHQLDLPTLRSIVRSFVTVFPRGAAILASNSLETPVIGLIGRDGGLRLDPAVARGRVDRATGPMPAAYGIEDEFALLGSLVAGSGALAAFAGDAPVNTDDRTVVAYLAPRMTYAPDTLPRERLRLLGALSIAPEEVLAETTDAAQRRRLAAYWSARDRFIAAGRSVRPSADVVEMLAQVRAPLLDVLSESPDFRPAYDPLVRMAAALARRDAAAAVALLRDLVRIQPMRTEAAALLAQSP